MTSKKRIQQWSRAAAQVLALVASGEHLLPVVLEEPAHEYLRGSEEQQDPLDTPIEIERQVRDIEFSDTVGVGVGSIQVGQPGA